MKDTFYFSHDYNARQDIKIKKLLVKHGMVGYGVFWSIVEDLYNNANALPTDYESIAYELRIDIQVVKSVINDFDLFVIDGKEFGSKSIENRLNERNEKSKKARKSALARWNKEKTDANALQPQSESNAIKESKGKESKERSISLKQPSLEEIKEYILAKGYCVDAIKFYSYFTESNWVDSNGKKVKNWKQKIITWDNHSIKQQPTEPKTRTL